MKNKFYFLPLLFFFTTLWISCTDDVLSEYECDVSYDAGVNSFKTGQWKLVVLEISLSPSSTDYSCNQIIYNFQVDNQLIVTSDIPEDDDQFSGTFEYEIIESDVDDYMTIRIDKSSKSLKVESGKMIMSQAHFDGPIYHLVKL